jgi:hypothetical protein
MSSEHHHGSALLHRSMPTNRTINLPLTRHAPERHHGEEMGDEIPWAVMGRVLHARPISPKQPTPQNLYREEDHPQQPGPTAGGEPSRRRLPYLSTIYGRGRTDSQQPFLKDSNDSSFGSSNSSTNAVPGPGPNVAPTVSRAVAENRYGPPTRAQRFIFVNRK